MSIPLIKKAVFPVAGLGTRFLPVTKATPKEMLPIVDKPLIQFAVEEATSIGVEQLIFVTSMGKRAIEDHFDTHYELENKLAELNKQELLDLVRHILPKGVSCVYIRQPEPLGLGHAIWCARQIVGNEPFAVLLADDLIESKETLCLQEMLALHQKTAASVIAVQTVSRETVNQYGIVALNEEFRLSGIVEKPHPEAAPSQLAAIGRYILTPGIFSYLSRLEKGSGNEVQLTDAIAALLKTEAVYAYPFTGNRYDCGSKIGYLKALVAYGLKHPETAIPFAHHLRQYWKENKLVEALQDN